MAYRVSEEVLLLAGYIPLVREGTRLEAALAQVDRMAPERGGTWSGEGEGKGLTLTLAGGGEGSDPNASRVAPERGGTCLDRADEEESRKQSATHDAA